MKLIELTKVCTKCGIRLVWNVGFHKKKRGRFGLIAECKICSDKRIQKWKLANPGKAAAIQRRWQEANPEKVAAKKRKWKLANPRKIAVSKRKWSKANPEKERKRTRKWRNANPEKIAASNRKWRLANPEKKAASDCEWRKANPEKVAAYNRKWEKANPERRAASNREWVKANPEKMAAKSRKWKRKQYQKNDKYRLNRNISGAISRSLNGNKAGRHWEMIVNYTLDELKQHLEKQFTEGMSWETYGKKGWTVDHKIPLSVHNFTKPEHEDFIKAWELSNLQPMWFQKNYSKGAKLTKHFQPSLLL